MVKQVQADVFGISKHCHTPLGHPELVSGSVFPSSKDPLGGRWNFDWQTVFISAQRVLAPKRTAALKTKMVKQVQADVFGISKHCRTRLAFSNVLNLVIPNLFRDLCLHLRRILSEYGGPLTVDPKLFLRNSLTSGDVLRRITSALASLLISEAGGPLTDKDVYSRISEDLPGSLSPSYDKIRLAV